MTTPITGITVPTYGPNTFTDLASMAASLEALGVPRFATAQARDVAITAPVQGQCCTVAGTLYIYSGSSWGQVQSGGGASLNRTVVGNDNASTTVTDTGGSLSVPLPVTVAAPSGSSTQLAAGTMTLRSAIQTLANNIAQLFASQGQTTAQVAFASGYSQYSNAYINPTIVKTGNMCVLHGGPVYCPASFPADTYQTWATAPTGFRPVSGHVLGVAMLYGDTDIVVQARANTSGALEFVSPVAVSGVAYLIVPTMAWLVA